MWVNLTRDELSCGDLVPPQPLWAPVVCHYCWKYGYYSGAAWHLLRIQGLCLHSREKCNYLGTWRKECFLAGVIQVGILQRPLDHDRALLTGHTPLLHISRLTFDGHTCRHFTWLTTNKDGIYLLLSGNPNGVSTKDLYLKADVSVLYREDITEKLYWMFHNQENTEFQMGLKSRGYADQTRKCCHWPWWVSLILTLWSVSLCAGNNQLQRIQPGRVTRVYEFHFSLSNFDHCVCFPGPWGQRWAVSLRSLF